jgi:adenylate cyclase
MRTIDTRCNCCSKPDGHERIATAASGSEAIALIEKEKFSLVLLDLMMPDLNGDEVLKVIRSDPDKRDIPVVMISADTDTDKVSQCIELGADDYLPKPFNPTILRARIGAALRRQSLRALESEYAGKIENEKRHSENLLRNILPVEIATRLRTGKATSRIISTTPPSFLPTSSASARSRRA